MWLQGWEARDGNNVVLLSEQWPSCKGRSNSINKVSCWFLLLNPPTLKGNVYTLSLLMSGKFIELCPQRDSIWIQMAPQSTFWCELGIFFFTKQWMIDEEEERQMWCWGWCFLVVLNKKTKMFNFLILSCHWSYLQENSHPCSLSLSNSWANAACTISCNDCKFVIVLVSTAFPDSSNGNYHYCEGEVILVPSTFCDSIIWVMASCTQDRSCLGCPSFIILSSV